MLDMVKNCKLFRVLRWADRSDTEMSVPADYEPANINDADVVSSAHDTLEGYHYVIMDIDIPAVLIPSSTPGHSHLYIDSLTEWDKIVKLLRALRDAGVVEPGYVDSSISRGFTCVRLPWVSKKRPLNDFLEGAF